MDRQHENHSLGISEASIIRAARKVIYEALTSDRPIESKVQLAKWVIENIWTPAHDEE